MLVGLLAMCWLCSDAAISQAYLAPQLGEAADQSFNRPVSWAKGLTPRDGWGPDHPRLLAYVNDDKSQDVVGFGDDGVWLAASNTIRFNPTFVLADFGYNSAWRVDKHVRALGDINGDTLEDIVGFGDAGVYRALSTATGFAEATFVVANFGYDQGWRVDKHVRLLADINNDGQKDIVAFGDAGVWLALATADGFFSEPAFVLAEFGSDKGWTPAEHLRTTADVNGDGLQDIVGFGDAGVWTALSTGDGFGPAQFVLAEFGTQAGGWRVDRHPRFLVDIDGDRDQDIVAFGDAGVWTARAAGGGFEAAQFVLVGFEYNSGWRVGRHPRFVADLNGDGYQDIVGYGEETVYRALGGPRGFDSPRGVLRDLVADHGFASDSSPRYVGDVNGDGKHDLVAFAFADIAVALSSASPPPPPPAAPSNLRVTNKTSTSLSIAWDDNAIGERRYFIICGKAGSGTTQTVTVDANVTSHKFELLDPRTAYCFTVQAESIFDVSAESARVCARTKKEATTPPPPSPTQPQGISRVHIFNCHSDRRPVNIWTFDFTLGIWEERGAISHQWDGSGTCPGSAAPFVVELKDGHLYRFVAVDPQSSFCGGANDPQRGDCQKSVFEVRGDTDGPALRHLIQ